MITNNSKTRSIIFLITILAIALTCNSKFMKLRTSDTGICNNNLFSVFPSGTFDSTSTEVINNIVIPLLSAVGSIPQGCIGRFSGETLKTNVIMRNSMCNEMPLNFSLNQNLFALYLPNAVCPGDPGVEAMHLCFSVDDKGSVSVIINGKAAQCGISATGVGNIIKPFTEITEKLGFGFSPLRQFRTDLKLCYNSNSSITCGSLTAKGHFFFLVGIGLPEIKIGSKDLSDFIGIEADIEAMIDLGDVGSVVNSTIASLRNINDPNGGTNILNTIKNIGAEFSLKITGIFVLKLADITNGFLADLELEVASLNYLLSSGGSNSGTGIKNAGFYFSATSDILGGILDMLNEQFDTYAGAFGVDISLGNINITDIGFYFFVDDQSVAFKFDLKLFTFQCMFLYNSKKGSCQFKDNFFTAILQAGKWVVKKAAKFFDETGSEIASFANTGINFTQDAANEVANKAKQLADEAAKAAKAAADAAADAAKSAANTVSSGAKKAIKKIKKW